MTDDFKKNFLEIFLNDVREKVQELSNDTSGHDIYEFIVWLFAAKSIADTANITIKQIGENKIMKIVESHNKDRKIS